jgi:8-oxo-dGTP pyrophosphatase MutT (NUDIX family)
MPHKKFQVGQKAFIERDKQILVVFFPNGWLDFPGGRIEEGESDLVAALKREVTEETKLEIVVGAPFATWLSRGEAVYLVGYRCRYIAGEVELSDEHADYRWVDASSFRALDDGSAPFRALAEYFSTANCQSTHQQMPSTT